MTSTITAETLAAIAPSLDSAARELAHSNMPDGSHEAADFAVAYVRAIAETCGALAANQCASGEEWAPAEWLDGDSDAVTEAAEMMEIDLDGADWTALRRIYEAPSAAAFAACGLAVRAHVPAVETETTYSVTFRGAATVDAYSATEGADDNDALTLTETRERCEAYGVSAELRDSAGFVKGFVSADGSYSLT
jgi:hypothetical protein